MATAVRPQPPPVAVGHPEPAAAPVEGTTQTHTNVAQDVHSKFYILCECLQVMEATTFVHFGRH